MDNLKQNIDILNSISYKFSKELQSPNDILVGQQNQEQNKLKLLLSLNKKKYIKYDRIIEVGLLNCKQHMKETKKKHQTINQESKFRQSLVFYKLFTNAAFPLVRDSWWFTNTGRCKINRTCLHCIPYYHLCFVCKKCELLPFSFLKF